MLSLADALVCQMSLAWPVTVVLMDTGIWSLEEDVSHVTVTLRTPKVATVTRQDTLKLTSALRMRTDGETWFPSV